MKKFSLLLLFLVGMLTSANAQTEFLKGDMNGDNFITMTDANALVNVFVKELEPEKLSFLDNDYIAGEWYSADGSLILKEDGRCEYQDGGCTLFCSYKYIPSCNLLLLYDDETNANVMAFTIKEKSDDMLTLYLTHYGSINNYTFYYKEKPSPLWVTSIDFTYNYANIDIDETYQILYSVQPLEALDQTVTWTSSDPTIATVNEDGLVTPVSGGVVEIKATANDGSGVYAVCYVTVYDPYNGHEYVDLGLTSGTIWATCNIGANSPEEFGDFFRWGETEPCNTFDEEFSNYKWATDTYDKYSKYVFDPEYGVVDGHPTLELEDDAASENWGGEWVMPLQALVKELVDECTWYWTRENGVLGYQVIGKNGNSIFLPAADRPKGWWEKTGDYGYYWTSNVAQPVNTYADALHFDSSNVYSDHSETRYHSCSVRAVRIK